MYFGSCMIKLIKNKKMKNISKTLVAIILLTTSIVNIAGADEVNLTVKGNHNDSTRILDNNSVLFSGDSFQISVEVLEELYIYVFLIDSNNNLQQLKPNNSSSLVGKDQSISFPSNNPSDWYQLDENVGEETLIIVSSPTKLDTAQITNPDQLNALEAGEVKLEKFTIKHLSNKIALRGISDLDSIADQDLDSTVEISSSISENLGSILDNNGSQTRTILKIMEDSKGTELNSSSSTRGVKEIRIFEEAAPAVVYIETPMSVGTGVLISNDALIFTNSHVVSDSKKVWVYFMPKYSGKYSQDDYMTGMVVNNNKTADLALIKLIKNPVGVKPLSLADISSLKIGQDVHAIGHPGNGSQWTYTRGYIGQILRDEEWEYDDGIPRKARMLIQSQTPIMGGNSGGPLLDDNGKVIGVNTFGSDVYDAANYAVSVKDLKPFINEKFTMPKAPTKTSEAIQASYEWDGNVIRVGRSDWNGDGVKDTFYFIDDDYTGIWEVVLIEITNRDELIVVRDYDEDGRWNEKIINTNSNPDLDFHIYDDDGDGKADYYGYDDDEDGVVDRYEEA